MNLGKLLSAGKSVFGGGANKRYHEDKRVYLPKFNTGKNPFTPKPDEVPAAPATPAAPAAESKPVSRPAAVKAPATSGGAATAKAADMPASGVSVPRPVRSTSWTEKLNPFRTVKPAAPPMVNAVQVELSLDTVKPITNDLADADIEVVPVKSSTVMPKEPMLIPASRESWEFAGVRVVKPV